MPHDEFFIFTAFLGPWITLLFLHTADLLIHLLLSRTLLAQGLARVCLRTGSVHSIYAL